MGFGFFLGWVWWAPSVIVQQNLSIRYVYGRRFRFRWSRHLVLANILVASSHRNITYSSLSPIVCGSTWANDFQLIYLKVERVSDKTARRFIVFVSPVFLPLWWAVLWPRYVHTHVAEARGTIWVNPGLVSHLHLSFYRKDLTYRIRVCSCCFYKSHISHCSPSLTFIDSLVIYLFKKSWGHI